jgi:hypothetical protein
MRCAASREPALKDLAQRIKFFGPLNHEWRDDRAPVSLDDDVALSLQEPQSFSHRRDRNAEQPGDFRLFQLLASSEDPDNDLLAENLGDLVFNGRLRLQLPVSVVADARCRCP